MNRYRQKPAWRIWAFAVLCTPLVNLAAAAKGEDNAALLYYQAFIRCPPFDSFPWEVQSAVFKGTAAAKDVRKYVEQSRDVIQLIEAGSRISRCDWAIPSLQASELQISVQLREKTVIFLVGADASVLATDGHYREAFERLLTLRRFAAHSGNEPNLGSAVPWLAEWFAIYFMGRVLDVMPPEKEVLTWLRTELTYETPTCKWMMNVLRANFERTLRFLRTDGEAIPRLRRIIPTMATETYKAKQRAWSNLTDEQLVSLIEEPYAKFLNDVAEALAVDMPYEQEYRKLDELVEAMKKEARDNPAIISDWTKQAEEVGVCDATREKAALNALRAAIQACVVVAENGQLPEALPEGAPKDPFSGRDFEYERTPSGFILRCRIKPVERDKPWEFEFKVREKN